MVLNLGSCVRLLASGNGCGNPGEGSISNSSGLYEWTVMPFSLCNALSIFARLMEVVLKGLHWKICLIYLDDVIVMGRTFEEKLQLLKEVFERLARAGLKLKPKKCFLLQKRVSYLGHVVTEEGLAADPEKVEQVRTWPIPENSTEVKVSLDLPLITADSSLISRLWLSRSTS